jgi:hypothetical protein
MNSDDQPTIASGPPGGARPAATGMWQAPSVEQVQAMPGLTVDADSIRTSGSGSALRMVLSPPDMKDYAVRVRYTGQVEVDLRLQNDGGFLFVLAQGSQTIFKRLHGGEKTSDDIGTTKKHPPGFDRSREHELIVTMQGSQIPAWMDGVFWGEGSDETLSEGAAAMMFLSLTAVKKVEIAELNETVSGAKAEAKIDDAFLRAVAAAPAEKQVELVSAKLNEVNGADDYRWQSDFA